MSCSEEEVEFTGEMEEEEAETPASSIAASPRKRKAVDYADNDEDSDSEDDAPLSSLKVKTPEKKKKTAVTKKKKVAPKKKESTVTASSTKTYDYPSMALYGTEADKGLLVQRLLCRWWYAYEWPDPSVVGTPPKNYEALDGFPGVYVCTKGDKVGYMVDKRDKQNCPSFKNMMSKPAAELKELLLKALKAQKEQLIQLEGSGTATEKEVDDLIKFANKVNPEKADKQAKKVLTANNLTL